MAGVSGTSRCSWGDETRRRARDGDDGRARDECPATASASELATPSSYDRPKLQQMASRARCGWLGTCLGWLAVAPAGRPARVVSRVSGARFVSPRVCARVCHLYVDVDAGADDGTVSQPFGVRRQDKLVST